MKTLVAIVAALCCCVAVANARQLSSSIQYDPKKMVVPCVMKIYGEYCYLEGKADTCTYYSNPSFATYKECKDAGPTKKCSDVSGYWKTVDGGRFHAACLDAEPTQRQKDGIMALVKEEEKQAKAADDKAAEDTNLPKGSWSVTNDRDIVGSDIECDKKSYCESCSPLDVLKKKCLVDLKSKGCVGFTVNPANGCAFFKTAAAGVSSAKWADRAKWQVHSFHP